MSDSRQGECYICGVDQAVFFVALYTIGSEGTWVCLSCRNLLTEFARKLHEFRYRAVFSTKRAP